MSEDPPSDTAESDANGYTYPFSRNDKEYNELKGKVPEVWFREGFDLQSAVSAVEKSIIEIAGPSQGGYHILDGIKLPAKVHITNVVANPMGMAEHAQLVDELVDARSMPYPDESVGMLLMHGLNRFVPPKGQDFDSEEAQQVEKEAEEEMRLLAAGQLNPADAKSSLRIAAYLESYRVLLKGGMIVVGGALAEDIKALERLGFELVCYDKDTPTAEEAEFNGTNVPSYETVMIKTG